MINLQTLLSTFDKKGTLLKWLKKLEAALANATLETVEVVEVDATHIKMKFVFADETFIESPSIELPRGPQGTQGQKGETGATGEKGEQGEAGKDALIYNGIPYWNSYSSEIDEILPLANFSRTPVVGDVFLIEYFNTDNNGVYLGLCVVVGVNGDNVTVQGQEFEKISIQPVTASEINSESATSGQVLQADGNGGASWQDANGGAIVAVDTLPPATEEEYDKHLLYLQEQSLKYLARKSTDGSISTVNTLPFAKDYINSAVVGTKIYLFFDGNTTIAVYDSVTNTIETLETVLPTSLNGKIVSAVGTDIYIIGGRSGSTYSQTIYKFDTLTNSISTLTISFSDCYAPSISIGTDIYIFGGRYGSGTYQYYDNIYKLDTLNNKIESLPTKMPKSLTSVSAVLVGNDFFIFGGADNNSTANYDIYKYNINTDVISTLSTTLSLKNVQGCAIGADIYIFGGRNSNNNYQNTIQRFSTVNNTLSTLSLTLPATAADIGVSSIGTDAFLFGGRKDGATLLNTINKFSVGFEYLFKTISTT